MHFSYTYLIIISAFLFAGSCSQNIDVTNTSNSTNTHLADSYRIYDERIINRDSLIFHGKQVNYTEYDALCSVKSHPISTGLFCYEYGDTAISYMYIQKIDTPIGEKNCSLLILSEPDSLTVCLCFENEASFLSRKNDLTKLKSFITHGKPIPAVKLNNDIVKHSQNKIWKTKFLISKQSNKITLQDTSDSEFVITPNFDFPIKITNNRVPPFIFVDFSDIAKSFFPYSTNLNWVF